MVECEYDEDSAKCAQCTKDSHGCYWDGVSRMGGVKGARGGIRIASKPSKGKESIARKESVATPIASSRRTSSACFCIVLCG